MIEMKQIMGSVEAENRGIASGIRSTVINVGDVIGVSLAGTIYSTFLAISIKRMQGNSAAFIASTDAYSTVFLSLGGVAILAALLSCFAEHAKTNTTET